MRYILFYILLSIGALITILAVGFVAAITFGYIAECLYQISNTLGLIFFMAGPIIFTAWLDTSTDWRNDYDR